MVILPFYQNIGSLPQSLAHLNAKTKPFFFSPTTRKRERERLFLHGTSSLLSPSSSKSPSALFSQKFSNTYVSHFIIHTFHSLHHSCYSFWVYNTSFFVSLYMLPIWLLLNRLWSRFSSRYLL